MRIEMYRLGCVVFVPVETKEWWNDDGKDQRLMEMTKEWGGGAGYWQSGRGEG